MQKSRQEIFKGSLFPKRTFANLSTTLSVIPYFMFQLIIEYLGQALNIDLSADLTVEQKAVARAFSIMADEHLIW